MISDLQNIKFKHEVGEVFDEAQPRDSYNRTKKWNTGIHNKKPEQFGP